MKRFLQILLLGLAVAAPVSASENAVVVRAATVYAKPSSVSDRVGKIDAGAEVSVFTRSGGWKEIFFEKNSLTGWVRSYQVREGNYAPEIKTENKSDSRGFLSGLAALSRKASGFFKSSSKPTSSGTATIGVRGLSEEEIKSAQADFEQLEKMKSFASDNKRARVFARKGKLEAKKIAYMHGKKEK